MKKAACIILTFVMIFSLTVIGFAGEEKLNYLVLGDSIAKGTGVLNSSEACYGRIVADTNGYNYVNRGVDGYDTSDLKKALNEKESYINDVAEADIISISIGGNDFINRNVFNILFLAVGMMFGNTANCERIVDNAYVNFCEIIARIKEINPDATILMQTLYAPSYPVIGFAVDKGVVMLNSRYEQYLEENPGAFTFVDIHETFEHEVLNIALDGIHPNARGNVLIAREILKTLYDLGLGENTEPVVNAIGVPEAALPVWVILKSLGVVS